MLAALRHQNILAHLLFLVAHGVVFTVIFIGSVSRNQIHHQWLAIIQWELKRLSCILLNLGSKPCHAKILLFG